MNGVVGRGSGGRQIRMMIASCPYLEMALDGMFNSRSIVNLFPLLGYSKALL